MEDESEIVDATFGFSPQSESSTTSNTIFARFVSYDPNTNIEKVALQIENNIPSGAWVLSWINVKDYYGNTTPMRFPGRLQIGLLEAMVTDVSALMTTLPANSWPSCSGGTPAVQQPPTRN